MAEHILKQLYNNSCFNLHEFISSLVYEKCDDHLEFMKNVTADYKSFVGNIFLTFPSDSNLPAFPVKLSSIPVLMKKDFVEFYSCSQFSLPCNIFMEKIFPRLTTERPLVPMFSIQLWDTFYFHVGETWLKFILRYGSLFILFPQDCLLQITGKTLIDLYYEVTERKKRKRKSQFEEASISKHFKICDVGVASTAPGINLHGTRLAIEISKILYSRNVVMDFPRHHVLEKLQKAGPDEASSLIEVIFQKGIYQLKTATEAESNVKKPVIASLKNEIVNDIIQAFLKNHRKVHFLEMLNAHCPFDAHAMPNTQSYCTPMQICSFMRAIIHRVIPIEMLGSKHNMRKMQDFCKVFVNASKGDHFSLEHLLYCMRIDDCKWIPGYIDREQRQIIFATLMNWLFSDYLLAVLQGYFYITDFEGQKKRLFFYRKDVWETLNTRLTVQLVRSRVLLDKCCKNQYEETLANSGEFACYGVARLLPKKMWSRLILNLKPSKKLFTCLKTYFCVLDYIVHRNSRTLSDLAGCSILCLPDFHAVWQRFIERFRVDGTLVSPTPLYFVKLDIHDCFSSVKLDLLDKVLRDACQFSQHNGIQEVDVYTYFTINKSSGRLVHQYKRMVVPKNECFLAHLKNVGNTNSILVDLERVTTVSIQKMIENLMLHLRNISVKLGERHFNLVQGLVQGSLLSPILSSLYYGHMENNFLNEFISTLQNGDLLIRYVDDYLFVVSEKEKAQKFLSIMHPGIPEYNCGTSCAKVLKNFDVEPNEEHSYHACAKKIDLIPWLGVLINSKTLEVTGDFSQYTGQSIAHTMTLDASLGKKGLKQKMILLIALGNQCMLFDKKINSRKTIVKNLYEYSLLNAFRMHSLSTKLSKSEGVDKHPDFYTTVILACINQICLSLCKLRNRQMIIYPLRNCATKWICLQAFLSKFKRHAVQYQKVLVKISEKSNDFAVKIGQNGISYFQRAIGPRIPRAFLEIQV